VTIPVALKHKSFLEFGHDPVSSTAATSNARTGYGSSFKNRCVRFVDIIR
jgi:hypothetical protein